MNYPISLHHHGAWPWEHHNLLYHHFHHPNYEVYQQMGSARHEREHMFEKSLTPSDVGKLNRLVIPKQHAEKYFPLDSSSGEKYQSLGFEDEDGNPWRFRYSYWRSSQSYVLTKGWSRFVRDKKLDAGDFVLFERVREGGGEHRLFIGWRHQGANESPPRPVRAVAALINAQVPFPVSQSRSCPCLCPVQQHFLLHAGDQGEEVVQNAAVAPAANSKRLRLFGVNLDCGPGSDHRPMHPAASFMPTTTTTTAAASFRQY